MPAPPATRPVALALLVPLLIAGVLVFRIVPRPATTRSVAQQVTTGSPALATATPVVPPSPVAAVQLRRASPMPVATPAMFVQSTTLSRPPLMIVRARRGGPAVRDAPSDTAPAYSGLYYDTYLPVYGQQTDARGVLWYQVQLWGVLTGWIRASQTETGNPPTPTPRPPAPPSPPPPRPGRSAVFPLVAEGVTDEWVNFRASSGIGGDLIGLLSPGTPLSVQAWQTDDQSSVWYRVSANGQTGWVWSGAVNLITPNPSKVMIGNQPIWSAVAGKGMWMPVPLMDMADPNAVVAAARALGLTHIYLEVGASGRGFYGRADVDRLLPAAHRAGIKVVGWVLTGLEDIPSDEALCTSVAKYRTPSGDRLDGIAPDIEDNMDGNDVAAFAQILRAQLGTNELIVGVIFPAGSWIGQHYPIAATLSRSFNVLAPMAYWHESEHPFSDATVADYIHHAVVDIQTVVDDPSYPVAVIGQTYDSFSRNGAGPNNPTGAEIETAMSAAKTSGAIGVSLFQWGTTTPSEWNVIRDFAWSRSAS